MRSNAQKERRKKEETAARGSLKSVFLSFSASGSLPWEARVRENRQKRYWGKEGTKQEKLDLIAA